MFISRHCLLGLLICLTLSLCSGCTVIIQKYDLDEYGNPSLRSYNYNLLRVSQVSQVSTLDPQTGEVALSQVAVDDEMSENLTIAWTKLMEVAGYALGGAAISAAAGGPTTPAAVAGGLIALTKQALTEKPEPVPIPAQPWTAQDLDMIRGQCLSKKLTDRAVCGDAGVVYYEE